MAGTSRLIDEQVDLWYFIWWLVGAATASRIQRKKTLKPLLKKPQSRRALARAARGGIYGRVMDGALKTSISVGLRAPSMSKRKLAIALH